MEKKKPLFTVSGGVKTAIVEISFKISQKLKTELPYDI